MTTNSIEECFELEDLEEKEYNRYIKVLIPKDSFAVVVDPYIINVRDLQKTKPGKVGIIRLRRPGWGKGNIQGYIYVLGEKKCLST